MKIIVSNHAKKRFVERFRLHYNRSWFMNNRVEELIIKLFDKSYRSLDFDQTPFYRNKLSTKHGRPVCIFKVDDVIFACTITDNICFLLTCMRKDWS